TVGTADLPAELRELTGVPRSPAPLEGQAPGTAGAEATQAAKDVAVAGDAAGVPSWPELLGLEVDRLLGEQTEAQRSDGSSQLMDGLYREFESAVIRTTLKHTRGRKIDAALRLGIGRNTITRKIQDLGLDDDSR
ncbi:MAG: helix-turn-helix domain-containing protein, partial [Quisquiliibacterium sp.]